MEQTRKSAFAAKNHRIIVERLAASVGEETENTYGIVFGECPKSERETER